jgi:hypothetical protein
MKIMATRKSTGGASNNAPEPEKKEIEAQAETANASKVEASEGQTEGTDMAQAATPKPERADEKPDAKQPKQPKLSAETAAVFEGLKGQFRYVGAPLSFECDAREEHNLATGKIYDIGELPKHVLIANALMRKTLVPGDPEQNTNDKEA